MVRAAFFTIGHSNRTSDEFIECLSANEIEVVVDVRKLPGSKKYPQFNSDVLDETLDAHDITLLRLEGLTGRRTVSTIVPFEVNGWWENRSFHNYADHALSTDFREALEMLRTWGATRRTAIMCAEAVWWRCHRRIIADYLLAADADVLHIMGTGQPTPADLSVGAVIDRDLTVTYPARSE